MNNILNSFISTTSTPTENDVVELVNEFIIKRQLEWPRIQSLSKLHPVFYSHLFRNIFGYNVPDLIKNASNIEEEVHNVQSIIDTLSLDILSISLSHITGEDVVSRNPSAVYNLLEIFKGYLSLINQRNITSSSEITSTTATSLSEVNSVKISTSTSSSYVSGTSTSSKLNKNSITSESTSGDSRVFIVNKIEPRSIKHLEESEPSTTSVEYPIKEPLDALYRDVFKPVPRRRFTPARKRSVLIPRCLKTTPKFVEKEIEHFEMKNEPKPGAFYSEITSALPGIELSKETKNVIRKEGQNHLKFMTVNLYNMENKKRKAQKQMEEAISKQRKLLDLAQKDAEDRKRLEEVKKAKENQIKVQAAFRDHALRKARMRKYCANYHTRHQKRMSQRSTKEEMLLKNVLKERLNLQKENLNDLNKRMRENEMEEAKNQRIKADAMTNFYETKISLMKESMETEEGNFNQRFRSQKRALDDFKRETRLKIEKEIEEIQDDLERRDDFHFRLADADRLRQTWK